MIFYKEYDHHKGVILGKRKKFDNTIYTFDIETSSYVILDGKVIPAIEYLNLSEKDQKRCIKQSTMYIWQFSINNIVYYGRTWNQLKEFLKMLTDDVPYKKYVFIHNQAFEFEYLFTQFKLSNVMARKSRKVITSELDEFNIEFRCSYYMTNVRLEKLPDMYLLPVEKQVGSLDYNLIRHSSTPLTDKEIKYCEYDCLVVYEYIKKELLQYETVNKIPITSTGHVRRELKQYVEKKYKYKYKVRKAINTDPHIYNLLATQCFSGGYTHANFMLTDKVLKNVDSYDFTSSYPYIMCTHLFPSTEFKPVKLDSFDDMCKRFAYLLVVRFKNIETRLYNTFISMSKCRHIKNGKYDNGRVISADELEMTITDVDFRIIKESYTFDYEILESYYSLYAYLPKDLINFILNKYVIKTEFKGVEGKELEYSLEKAKFNSIFGMSVTNTIRDDVVFDGKNWFEESISNEDILKQLEEDKKKGFLSFAYGVWVCSWGRFNLLSNVIKCDKYVAYCDTDSMKLIQGYDINVIENYNKKVLERIKFTSRILDIPLYKFCPKDKKGKEHMLGLFELETKKGNNYTYDEFITQGAKKYAVLEHNPETNEDEIHITVSGVPKRGSKALDSLDKFRDDFVFEYKDTLKNTIQYNDHQIPYLIKDYLGNEELVTDKSGCCILPASYTLGKSLEYADLISDNSSARAIYNEEV